MKKIRTILSTAVLMFLISSCSKEVISGSGPVVSQQRNISNFTGIDLSLNATVNYSEGSSFSVQLNGQQNILDAIVTELNDGYLVIRVPLDTKFISYSPITINITAPAVSNFNLSGNGTIQSSDTVHLQNGDLNISGSGNISLTTAISNDIDARVSGSGKVYIANGSSSTVTTNISGSGNIDMSGVAAQSVKTYTSGSGDTKVNAINNLDAHISGSGKVYYYGNPAITADISGSGKLIHL